MGLQKRKKKAVNSIIPFQYFGSIFAQWGEAVTLFPLYLSICLRENLILHDLLHQPTWIPQSLLSRFLTTYHKLHSTRVTGISNYQSNFQILNYQEKQEKILPFNYPLDCFKWTTHVRAFSEASIQVTTSFLYTLGQVDDTHSSRVQTWGHSGEKQVGADQVKSSLQQIKPCV